MFDIICELRNDLYKDIEDILNIVSDKFYEIDRKVSDFLKYADVIAGDKFEDFFDYLEPKIDIFYSKHPKVYNFMDKLWYLHPADDSDINDLIKDFSSNTCPSLTETIKRKIKYSYQSVVYLLS